MQNPGAIILIEDDDDDVELFSSIIEELKTPHELIVFSDIGKGFNYLKDVRNKPFLIVCDTNWHNEGMIKSFLKQCPEMKLKHIPFVIYSSESDNQLVNKAFNELNIQGYFEKRTSPAEMKNDISLILNYWETSKEPQLEA